MPDALAGLALQRHWRYQIYRQRSPYPRSGCKVDGRYVVNPTFDEVKGLFLTSSLVQPRKYHDGEGEMKRSREVMLSASHCDDAIKTQCLAQKSFEMVAKP
jgi:hypothetical protein